MASIRLILFTFLLSTSLSTRADELLSNSEVPDGRVKLSSRAFIHAVALIGPDFQAGVIPSDGAGFGLTLYDRNFADVELTLSKSDLEIHTSLAYDSVEPYYFSGSSNGDGFQLRELYLKAPISGSSRFLNSSMPSQSKIWIGARKYQKIDEHHLMGLGVEIPISSTYQLNITQGFRKDYPNWGTTDGDITTSNNDVTTQFKKPLRSLSILDLTISTSENSNWIWLYEYHHVGAVQGDYPNPAYGQTQRTFKFSPSYGQTLATEFNTWSATSSNSLALAYSKGDISTSPLSKLNTQGSSTEVWDQTQTKKLTNSNNKNLSEKRVMTWTGNWNEKRFTVSYLIAFSQDVFHSATKKDLELSMFQARPFYKIKDSRWQWGVDISRTSLSKSYSIPSYVHVAPILRYALMDDNFGRPFFAIWGGRSFYDRKYKAYEKEALTADTYGLQFEASF